MKKLFSWVRDTFNVETDSAPEMRGAEDDYVELDTLQSEDAKSKVIVRPYVLEDFSNIKEILDTLREGYTIALVNIKPLKDKDLVELKRSINKLKKTCDAIKGDIAGFGDDYIVVTPSFARIYRSKHSEESSVVEEQ
ncbi:cell division protein SepF [Candidatus Parvarchaeota archaeon]|nr:cell division protein SepF [Candidatus Parvarchaeota archaeon]